MTVNSQDDSLQPRTFTFDVEAHRQGDVETEIELKPDQRYDIYVSAVDGDGKPTESDLTLLGPVGGEEPASGSVLAALARSIAWLRQRLGFSRDARPSPRLRGRGPRAPAGGPR